MMMNKLIALVLVLAFAAPVLADDLIPAPFRGQPGTTMNVWTYDDGENVWVGQDYADSYSFVSDPTAGDPEGPGWQGWAGDGDPCTPDWFDTIPNESRQGFGNFRFGGWTAPNFDRPEPSAKDLWIQITYKSESGEAQPPAWIGGGYLGDPVDGGFWEGPLEDWTGGTEPEWMETWDDEGVVWGWWEGDPADWNPEGDPTWPDLLETWSEPQEFEIEGVVLESSEVLTDGWIHDVYSLHYPVNPLLEYIQMGLGPAGEGIPTILIDQVVMETICYVPEPATMALLGLGSLLMIRRKR
jgi:hypothetical protein